ncbi:Uncharacterised protein [uncultured archaeon]|nr:Uncharacterised protein [uncultured archaeon]
MLNSCHIISTFNKKNRCNLELFSRAKFGDMDAVKEMADDVFSLMERKGAEGNYIGCCHVENHLNSSELLSREVSKLSGIPLACIGAHTFQTKSYVCMSREEKDAHYSRNLFSAGRVEGKVILVDDCCASGITLSSWGDVFINSGARGIDSFVFIKFLNEDFERLYRFCLYDLHGFEQIKRTLCDYSNPITSQAVSFVHNLPELQKREVLMGLGRERQNEYLHLLADQFGEKLIYA